MRDFKKSPLAYVDDEIAKLAATDFIKSPPFVLIDDLPLLYLAQSTFKEDFSEIFSSMKWSLNH